MAEIAKAIIDVEINTGSSSAQLKQLQAQINSFNLSLNKSSIAQGAFAKEYAKELQLAINNTGAFTAETLRLSTAASTLDKTLVKGKVTLGQFFSAKFNKDSAVAAETMALAAERARRMQTQFIATSAAANGMQDALAIRPLAAFSSQEVIAAEKTQILSSMFRQGTTQLINFGKNVQWAGRQLMVGFTVPLTIFGTTAGKTFMELEKQVVSFKKVYGDLFTTPAELNQNLEAVKGLAKEYTKYGIAVKDTIGLASQAAAAGRQGKDLTDSVTQATRLATLGQMDQNTALETTISLQSAFKLSGQDLADTINFLNMVENQTVVSLQDISTAIPKVAPVIQGLGGDVKDLTVFLAAMQEGGVDAAEGANALKSGLASLINPTKQAKDMLSGFGINLDSIIQANKGDLMGTVMTFSQALQNLDQFSRQQALEQVFGKFQYAKLGALFDNISRKGSQAQQVIATMGYTTEQLGATADKELKTIEQSFGVQLTGAIERFKLAIAPIGEIFVKTAIPIVNFLTSILEKFNNLSDGKKQFIAIAAAIVGVVIPAGTMLLGLLMNLIGTLLKLFQGFGAFSKGFISGGPAGAIKALTQSSKYLSLAEIDAAMAAQQLAVSSEAVNAALLQQATAAGIANTGVQQLIRTYEALIATQMAVSTLPPFSIATSAAKGIKTGGSGFKVQRRNSGGPIFMSDGTTVPGVGNTDTVPAMLTPGEFVVNKEATSQNLDLLHQINGSQKLNSGGMAKGIQYFGFYKPRRVVQKTNLENEEQYLSQIFAAGNPLRALSGSQTPIANASKLVERAHFSTGKVDNINDLNSLISRGIISRDDSRVKLSEAFIKAGVPVTSLSDDWVQISKNINQASKRNPSAPLSISAVIDELNTNRNLVSFGGNSLFSKMHPEVSRDKFVDDMIEGLAKHRDTYGDINITDKILSNVRNSAYPDMKNAASITGVRLPTKNDIAELIGLPLPRNSDKVGNQRFNMSTNEYFRRNGIPIEMSSEDGYSRFYLLDSAGGARTGSSNRVAGSTRYFNSGGMIPKFSLGGVMPAKFAEKLLKLTNAQKMAAEEASRIKMPITTLGNRISSIGGRSSSIPGVNGVYDIDGQRYVVKGHDSYDSAVAEAEAAKVMRDIFGLKTPNQSVVKIKHPNTGQDMFAVRSKYDEMFATSTEKFDKSNSFDQIIAAAVRRDKDLQSGNLWGDVVADVGQAGIMNKASQPRVKTGPQNSVLDQLAINFGMVKGSGARTHAAEAWNSALADMTDTQIISGIKQAAINARGKAASANLPEDFKYIVKDLDEIIGADLNSYVAGLRMAYPKEKAVITDAAKARKESEKVKNAQERKAALAAGYPDWALRFNKGGKIPGIQYLLRGGIGRARDKDLFVNLINLLKIKTRGPDAHAGLSSYVNSLNPAESKMFADIAYPFVQNITSKMSGRNAKSLNTRLIMGPLNDLVTKVGLPSIAPYMESVLKQHYTHMTKAYVDRIGRRFVSRYVTKYYSSTNLQANQGTLEVNKFLEDEILSGKTGKYDVLIKEAFQNKISKDKAALVERQIDQDIFRELSKEKYKGLKISDDKPGTIMFEDVIKPIIDRNIIGSGGSRTILSDLSRNVVQRKNNGGPIFMSDGTTVPGVGNTDTVPAMLTPGEFVVNKESTKQNLDLLHSINNGTMSGYNKGGKITGVQYFAGGGLVGMLLPMIASQLLPQLLQGMGVKNEFALNASMMLPFMLPSMKGRRKGANAENAAENIAAPKIGREAVTMFKNAKQTGGTFSAIGQVAKKMLPRLLGLSGGFAAAAAGIALVGVGLYKLNKSVKNAEKSGGELAKAMNGSADRTESMAKTFGRETYKDAARRKAVEKAGGQEISQESSQISSQFMQTDTAKQMIKDLQLVKEQGKDTAEALRNQLATSIMAGAISPEEAKAIAIDMGNALKDEKLSIKVAGQLNKLMGPDGKDLFNNIAEITAEINPKIDATQIGKDAQAAFDKLNVGQKAWKSLFGGQEDFVKNFKIDAIADANAAAIDREAQAREALNAALQQGIITLEEYKKQEDAVSAGAKQRSKVVDDANARAKGYASAEDMNAKAQEYAKNKAEQTQLEALGKTRPLTQQETARLLELQGLTKEGGKSEKAYNDVVQPSRDALKQSYIDQGMDAGQAKERVLKIESSLGQMDPQIFNKIMSGEISDQTADIMMKFQASGVIKSGKDLDEWADKLDILETLPNIDLLIDIENPDPEKLNNLYNSYTKLQTAMDEGNLTKEIVIETTGVDGNAITDDVMAQLAQLPSSVSIPILLQLQTDLANVTQGNDRQSAEEIKASIAAAAIRSLGTAITQQGGTGPKDNGGGGSGQSLSSYMKDLRSAMTDLNKYKTILSGIVDIQDMEAAGMLDQAMLLKMSTAQRQEAIRIMREQMDVQAALQYMALSSEERQLQTLKMAAEIYDAQSIAAQNTIDNIQHEIDLQQRQIDIRNHALDQLSEQEQKINEVYDLRIKALDEVAQANDRLAAQEQGRIDLASALASGNIAGAAQAVSGITQQNAQYRLEDARAELEKQREEDIKNLKVEVNGVLLTRKQIEDQIKAINETIYQYNLQMIKQQDILYKAEQKKKAQLQEIEKLEYQIFLHQQAQTLESLKRAGLTGSALDDLNAQIAAYNKLAQAAASIGISSPILSPATATSTSTGTSAIFTDSEFLAGIRNSNVSYKAGDSTTEQAYIARALGVSSSLASTIVASDMLPYYQKASDTLKASVTDLIKRAMASSAYAFAKGGLVPGFGNTDSISAKLTPGEFVMTKASTKAYLPLLEALNNRKFPKLGQPTFSLPEQASDVARQATQKHSTLYNDIYTVNVNVAGTQASPEDIADVVMSKLAEVNRGNVRGIRR